MNKLIKLELRRNNIRTYMIASVIISIVMLGFLYFFAYAPRLEPMDADMLIFSGYNNLIPLFSTLNMAVFCVLSAVMYTKFVIEDYSGKRPVLLFSYPISRKRILLSKLSVVTIFTILAMIISNLIVFMIFGITENFLHLVAGDFTFSIIMQVIKTTIIMAIIAASIGIIAVGIGFIKKSIPATIVSAVLISSLMCNIVVNATSSMVIMSALALIMILIGMVFSAVLMQKVNYMEVE